MFHRATNASTALSLSDPPVPLIHAVRYFLYALLLLKQNHFPYAFIPYLPVLESDFIGSFEPTDSLVLMFVSFLLNGRGGGIRTLIVWFVAKESIQLAYAPMGSLLGVEPSIRGSQPRVMPIHQKLHEAGAGRENRTPIGGLGNHCSVR